MGHKPDPAPQLSALCHSYARCCFSFLLLLLFFVFNLRAKGRPVAYMSNTENNKERKKDTVMEKNHCRKKEKEDKILPPSILASSPPRPCREGFLTELYLLIWPMQFKRSKGDGCNRNSIHKWKVLRILLDSGSRPGHAVRAWFTQEISHLAVTQSPSHSLPLPSEARAPFHSLGISKKVF